MLILTQYMSEHVIALYTVPFVLQEKRNISRRGKTNLQKVTKHYTQNCYSVSTRCVFTCTKSVLYTCCDYEHELLEFKDLCQPPLN